MGTNKDVFQYRYLSILVFAFVITRPFPHWSLCQWGIRTTHLNLVSGQRFPTKIKFPDQKTRKWSRVRMRSEFCKSDRLSQCLKQDKAMTGWHSIYYKIPIQYFWPAAFRVWISDWVVAEPIRRSEISVSSSQAILVTHFHFFAFYFCGFCLSRILWEISVSISQTHHHYQPSQLVSPTFTFIFAFLFFSLLRISVSSSLAHYHCHLPHPLSLLLPTFTFYFTFHFYWWFRWC